MSLLGIDLGTTGIKAAAVSEDGKIISKAYREYILHTPKPGIVELDPNIVWESLCENIKEINAQIEVKSDPIVALSISVSGDEALPIDKKGLPLYNTIMSMDTRTIKQNEWINEQVGTHRLYEITGQPPSRIYPLNKLIWFKQYRPKIFENTYKFLCWEEFIFYKLGIDPITDYSVAARTLAFDIKRKRWSDEILNKTNISKDYFPNVVPSGTEVGKVARDLASKLGFINKVSIVTGGFDQNCAALGAGVIKKGMASVGTGTMEAMQVCFDKFISDKKMLFYGYAFSNHVISNSYIGLSTNYCAGALLKWYRDNLFFNDKEIVKKEGMDIYDLIVAQAKTAKFPVLCLPYFEGAATPRNNPDITGIILGMSLRTKKGDIIRGILEGITFDLRLNIEKIQESGLKIESIRNIGGGAQSDYWLQLKADITGKMIQKLDVVEAGCVSASVLAGYGIGIFNTIEEVIEKWTNIKKEFYPDKEKFKKYSEKYQQFLEIYDQISDYKILY